jgi:hypothetical protein
LFFVFFCLGFVLFCSVLFSFSLFYFVLFCFVLGALVGHLSCRFHFPKPLREESSVVFQEHEGVWRVDFEPRRNDPLINEHAPAQLLHWMANVDFSLVLDEAAAARYLSRYASKGETRSSALQRIAASVSQSLDRRLTIESLLRRAFIRAAAERD